MRTMRPHVNPRVPDANQTTYCPQCGERHHRDVGCSYYCGEVARARYAIEKFYPGTGLQHQNLVKFSGHLAAGLHKAFTHSSSRAGFYPTRAELDQATALAVRQFLETEYVLRKTPNGSMTELQSANAVNSQPTNEGERSAETK